MNAQEIFDKAATHLIKQNRRAIGNGCMYRADNGLMCAVGALIPEELYNPKMESDSVEGIMHEFPEIETFLGKENLDLLSSLQTLHDDYAIEEWPQQLRQMAREFELSTIALDKTLNGNP